MIITTAEASTNRNLMLDGLRGVAILLVVLFHTFARRVQEMPWVSIYHEFPIFKLGYLGVQLFFLISGFVIYMSLQGSSSFKMFIYKRWLRLFPAMLIATTFIFLYSTFFIDKFAYPRLIDALPGLLFIEPVWLSYIIGTNIEPLEGAFWTLFVEFKFYVLFGISYFYFRKNAIAIIAALFVGALICELAKLFHMDYLVSEHVFGVFHNFIHFGWFVAGAWFYEARKNQSQSSYFMSALFAALSCFYLSLQGFNKGYGLGLDVSLTALTIYLFFVLSFYINIITAILSSKLFVLIGFVSYPYYLIHENLLVKFTTYLHTAYPSVPDMLTPVMPLTLIFLIAWIIAKYAEPSFRNTIKTFLAAPAILAPMPRL